MNCFRLVLIAALCLFYCNRQTLRYFFDGMDQPRQSGTFERNSQLVTSKNTMLDKMSQPPDTTRPAKFMHPDYKKRACSICHQVDHAYRLTKHQPDLCYQCHKSFNQKYEVLHGPVAAGFCTACHQPHQSQYEHLLKMPIRETCIFCHKPGEIIKNEAHQDINTIECLHCHNSHGGKTLNMLKGEAK